MCLRFSRFFVFFFSFLFFFFCFFFQAEDGIRDTSVTGVQTCALPIFANVEFSNLSHVGQRRRLHPAARNDNNVLWLEADLGELNDTTVQYPLHRSEERRVGKECRSRWSTDH